MLISGSRYFSQGSAIFTTAPPLEAAIYCTDNVAVGAVLLKIGHIAALVVSAVIKIFDRFEILQSYRCILLDNAPALAARPLAIGQAVGNRLLNFCYIHLGLFIRKLACFMEFDHDCRHGVDNKIPRLFAICLYGRFKQIKNLAAAGPGRIFIEVIEPFPATDIAPFRIAELDLIIERKDCIDVGRISCLRQKILCEAYAIGQDGVAFAISGRRHGVYLFPKTISP